MNVLQAINKLGTTVIVVTHDTEIVGKLKNRVIELDQGRILKEYEEGEFVYEGV